MKFGIFASVILLLGGCVWWMTNQGDPLADQKKVTESVAENEREIRLGMQDVLRIIEHNKMHELADLMNRNYEDFESQYLEPIFAEKNFCPAEIVKISQQKRGGTVSVRVIVHSNARNQNYVFTLLPRKGKKGKYVIMSILPTVEQ